MTSSESILHNGDCVAWLSQLPAGTANLVFADPPFNIDYSYDVYDDSRSDEDYLAFCRDWITGVHRVLADDGTFWLAIGDEYAAELKILSQQIGFHCRSWVIWYYTFGVNNRRGFSRSHTHLFHFVKDKDSYTFNLDNPAVRVASARQLVYADRRANPKGRLPDNTWILRPQDAPPGSFATDHDTWFYSRVAGTFKEREGFHGCQMPEQLLGRIIRLCSMPGDVVLDPFGGSGTTLVTAKKLHRRPMGCELSPDYVERIEQRLADCRPGDPLDGPADAAKSSPATGQGRSRGDVIVGGTPPSPTDADVAAIRSAWRTIGDDDPLAVLCDPHRRAAFDAACKAEKVVGGPRIWHHHLLAIVPPSNAAVRSDAAAEAAMRVATTEYAMDRIGVLCSDEAIDLFDQLRLGFGGNEPFDATAARLAAVRMNLADGGLGSGGPSSESRSGGSEPRSGERSYVRQNVVGGHRDAIPSTAGVYTLQTESGDPIYIGYATNTADAVPNFADGSAWHLFGVRSVSIDSDGTDDDRRAMVKIHRPPLNLPLEPLSDSSDR